MEKLTILLVMAMCAMINIYAYYVTFYYIFNTNCVLLFKFCLSFEDIWIILMEMHVLLIEPQLTQFYVIRNTFQT